MIKIMSVVFKKNKTKKITTFFLFLFSILFFYNLVQASSGSVIFDSDVLIEGFGPDVYIESGSSASSIEIGSNSLNVYGIYAGDFFSFKNNIEQIFLVSPLTNGFNFFIADGGMNYEKVTSWSVDNEISTNYKLKTSGSQEEYSVYRNGLPIGGSPFSIDINNEITFTASGSGFYQQIATCVEHNFTGYAWSSNIGWISFSCENEFNLGEGNNFGIDINNINKTLSGYAWSSNIGWISFNSESVVGCPGGGDCNPRIEELDASTNKIVGWARACSVFSSGCSGDLKSNDERGDFTGWIELHDVRINTDGSISGWAWGGGGSGVTEEERKENATIGWIDVSGLSVKYILSYSPNIEFKIDNNISYCNDIYEDGPYLRVVWEYLNPDESYQQKSYQIIVYDSGDNIVWQTTDLSGNPSKVDDSFTRSVVIHEDMFGNPYLNYNESYRAEIRTWTENTVSDWIQNIGGYYDMPIHHYPMIDYSWIPVIIDPDEEIAFTETARYGGSSSFSSRLWSFGPDVLPSSTTSNENPTVIFEKSGRRNVSLRITDSSGYQCVSLKNMGVRYPMPTWKEVSPFGN
jgi:hypothetical protein